LLDSDQLQASLMDQPMVAVAEQDQVAKVSVSAVPLVAG
jgi:hypothetical protein